MSSSQSPQIPISKALVWVALSIVFISGSVACGWLLFQRHLRLRRSDSSYLVTTLAHSCYQGPRLPHTYLSELLGLSANRPSNLYAFDAVSAQKRLVESPVIQDATVQTFAPNIVAVSYATYAPIAYIGDCSNTIVDADGHLAPCQPFFTPKKLPTLYLGLQVEQAPNALLGTQLQSKEFELARNLLWAIQQIPGLDAATAIDIDVSEAFSSSYGQRQVVLSWQENVEIVGPNGVVLCRMPRLLRLDPKTALLALEDYPPLQDHLKTQQAQELSHQSSIVECSQIIIDMRLPQVALLTLE